MGGSATTQALGGGSSGSAGSAGSSGTSGAGVAVTTKGDVQTFSTTSDRLPVGTDGKVLTANSAASYGLSWETVSGGGGGGNLTTKGDLEVYGTSQTRLGVGADGKVLTANSSATYGLSWETASGGGGGITTGKAIAMAIVFG